jgi:hypothetical protein
MGAPIGNKNASGKRHSSFKNVGAKLKNRAEFRKRMALLQFHTRAIRKTMFSPSYINKLSGRK